jgi:hypothetical protein
MTLSFLSPFFSVVVDNHWVPGVGDPSLLGWFTAFAYGITAVLCGICALKCKRADRARFLRKNLARPKTYPQKHFTQQSRFWWILWAVTTCLGLNKQLDIQTAVTIAGRDLAKFLGFYAYSRLIQKLFLILLAGVGIYACYNFLSNYRQFWKSYRLVYLGLGFLMFFIMTRAAAFNHVQQLVSVDLATFPTWILELLGIACIAGAALKHLRRS